MTKDGEREERGGKEGRVVCRLLSITYRSTPFLHTRSQHLTSCSFSLSAPSSSSPCRTISLQCHSSLQVDNDNQSREGTAKGGLEGEREEKGGEGKGD